MTKIINESLGVSKEVDELSNDIMQQVENVINDRDKQMIIPRNAYGNKSAYTRIVYTLEGNWFDGAIKEVEIHYNLFSTLEDYYGCKQKNSQNMPYYAFNEKKVFIPIDCEEKYIPFSAVRDGIKSILSHELLHAYQSFRKKNGVENDIYIKATEGMKEYPNPHSAQNLMCQLVYFSSLFEIDAQAHNYIENLRSQHPHDINAAKQIKPYAWINTIKMMANDVFSREGSEDFQKGLECLGIDNDTLKEIIAYGNKYRQRKFDRVIALYFQEDNVLECQIKSSQYGPIEIAEEVNKTRQWYSEEVKKLIENIS